MKRKVALGALCAVLIVAALWWWLGPVPKDAPLPAGHDGRDAPAERVAEAPAATMPVTPSARDEDSPPSASRATTQAEDAAEPEGGQPVTVRASCRPERSSVALSSEVIESVENVLALSQPAEAAETEAQMSQCLELRDLLRRHDMQIYRRGDAGELSRSREAVARCWEIWYAQPDGQDAPEHVARSQAMEEVLGEAAALVQAQDHEALLAMTDALAAMDAPMTVYDDWDPPVDLPYVLALRADAPVDHFIALLERGVAPSPRALSRMASNRRLDVLEALHEAGFDLGETDMAGNDVVHGAVQSGDPAVLRRIAALGVDFDRTSLHPQSQHGPRMAAAGGRAQPGDALELLLEQHPELAAEAIRGGYRVGPEHLEAILLHAPKDIADAVYLALREDGCA